MVGMPSFWIGATGLSQQQKGLDVVSNNVSNVNTTGFKGSQVHFQDIFVETVKLGGRPAEASASVNPLQRGRGVLLGAISKDMRQGSPDVTGVKTDLAILGEGFFVLQPTTADLDNNAEYYTRDGHFQATPSEEGADSPTTLVSSQGYRVKGTNATLDTTTGLYTLPSTGSASTEIEFDTQAELGPHATTAASLGFNLDSSSPLSIDPIFMEMTEKEVTQRIRIEFQKASVRSDYFFFKVTQPTPNATTLDYDTMSDGITGAAITGVIKLDAQGNVEAVYQNTDTNDFLTTAEIAGLTAWTNVNGSGRPIFTVGTAPAGAVTAEAAGTLSAPAAFALGFTPDANSVTVSLNGTTLVSGTDYTLAGATITPVTAWAPGNASVNYTTAGGAQKILGEIHPISNANFMRTIAVANEPITTGTLVVNATRGAAAVVANTDYTVDLNMGTITPLTFWNAGAVTVNYTPADTRITVIHGVPGLPITFTDTSQNPLAPESVTPLPAGDLSTGMSLTAWDDDGSGHSLVFGFERLSDNRWLWKATPLYRSALDSTVVSDNAAGGGTSLDGLTVIPATFVTLPGNQYDVKLTIDEGVGPIEWTQISSASPAFPSTGAGTYYYRVTDPATGAIALSRDLATTGGSFSILAEHKSNVTTGDGILAFDLAGNYDAANSSITNAISFSPQGATTVSITPDFTDLRQARRKSDVSVLSTDGFGRGELEEWKIDDLGRVTARYSNGKTQYLSQIGIARFPTPEGLLARGENTFIVSASSGDADSFLPGDPEQKFTALLPGFLEASNVDLSQELSSMILFQRVYQFNSRIITTSDEMVQEAIRMKR